MAGYYDHLEDQLARATTRGVPRRRLVARPRLPRARWSWVAVAATVGVCVAVSLVIILGARSSHHNAPTTVPHHVTAPLPVIRNYAPHKAPPLGGRLYCDGTFTATHAGGSAKGSIVVHNGTGPLYVYALTAKGLKPAPPGERYEVWALAETNETFGGYALDRGVKPSLVGVIEPSVTANGLIAAKGTLSSSYSGWYRVLVTVQRPGLKAPGRVVLRTDIPL